MDSQFPLLSLSQFVNQLEEEIPKLRAEVQQLQAQIQEPREVAFADVLLRRSKYVIILQLLKLDGSPCLLLLCGKNNACHLPAFIACQPDLICSYQ